MNNADQKNRNKNKQAKRDEKGINTHQVPVLMIVIRSQVGLVIEVERVFGFFLHYYVVEDVGVPAVVHFSDL